MFRKILVGLDGSETSWAAFERALTLAREHDADLWAPSVEDHLPRFPATIGETREEDSLENAYFAEVQQRVRQVAEEQCVQLQAQTMRGQATERLVQFARRGGFDLIVVGHRGHSNPWHCVAGSTADWVVDHAPCCVLVHRKPKTSESVAGDAVR